MGDQRKPERSQSGKGAGRVVKWLTRRSAKPLCAGSTLAATSTKNQSSRIGFLLGGVYADHGCIRGLNLFQEHIVSTSPTVLPCTPSVVIGPLREQVLSDLGFLTPREVKRGWQIFEVNGIRLKVLTPERRASFVASLS